MEYKDLDDATKGRISGLIEAADMLTEQRIRFHDDKLDDERETTRRHHNACSNTCKNTAREIQRAAFDVALEEAERPPRE